MDYILHILILFSIYVILALSLNLIVGFAGLMNMAQAAFFGIGAYCAALLALNVCPHFIVNLLCTMAVTAIVGLLVAWPALRVHDDYFVIASFGLQIIFFSIMNNWFGLTRGPLGLPDIPRPQFGTGTIDSHWEFLVLSCVFSAAVFLVCQYIVGSPYGRVLKAIREDEVFAKALGKDVLYAKLSVFALGASLASIAGCIYAVYVTYIDPTSFTMSESIFLFSIVIIGGLGNLWGSVIGAAILVVLPELLRFIGISQTYVANIRQIIYGTMLIAMMFLRPQGILGEYELGRLDRGSVFDDENESAT